MINEYYESSIIYGSGNLTLMSVHTQHLIQLLTEGEAARAVHAESRCHAFAHVATL